MFANSGTEMFGRSALGGGGAQGTPNAAVVARISLNKTLDYTR